MKKPLLVTPSGAPRARSIPIPFEGQPGPCNAITDVEGVKVGYTTLIEGEGPLIVGQGPIRTGVTAILPRPHADLVQPAFAGYHSFNGNGELSGMHWIEEAGELLWPITLTNTHSCGLARDATIKWVFAQSFKDTTDWSLPVAGETYDGDLNDINGFHVSDQHVFDAIDSAESGPINQGSVGGGTGMICYDFNAGSGTASRQVEIAGKQFTVGVFVQANFGLRRDLVIAGVPVGRHITGGEVRSRGMGSIIAVIATDAPLLPHQLKRLSRRASLGIGRSGTIGSNSSGDIFLAFSTQQITRGDQPGPLNGVEYLSQPALDPIFAAVVQAVDEAVIDSIVTNTDLIGRDGITAVGIPHDELRKLLANSS
jgi:L-aminopeptidase/D-esterase-like protein